MEMALDSDVDTGNSSLSSMSSTGSYDDLSTRHSFDTAVHATGSLSPAAAMRPHRASDAAWGAVRARARPLGHRDFKLVRRIGSGDIGNVYLCRLCDDDEDTGGGIDRGNPCLFAMKIVDKRELARKKKLERAATEKRILKQLDHPFLPTLFADFDASPHLSCVVMEFCGGGDLHTLRHRMPGCRFTVSAVRFYAAEVLVALEYLHVMGIVYRDLKPENILIRSDGHIMLSDFDLSMQSTPASPTLQRPASVDGDSDDGDAQPPSCFLFLGKKKLARKNSYQQRLCRFIAEPVAATSGSFVGTHEYISPEVAAGRSHGSAVDWWAYGILLYELLYGATPFAGDTNEATLRNIVKKPLTFPPGSGECAAAMSAARELIGALLVKDPASRLGARGGAADVREHAFFKGVKFALLRSCRPPVVPALRRSASCHVDRRPSTRLEYF